MAASVDVHRRSEDELLDFVVHRTVDDVHRRKKIGTVVVVSYEGTKSYGSVRSEVIDVVGSSGIEDTFHALSFDEILLMKIHTRVDVLYVTATQIVYANYLMTFVKEIFGKM